jgi:hypothetical protein
MASVQSVTSIPVDLTVSRYEEYPDNMVQVWGHVGDYEVSIWLPANDPRLHGIVRPNKRRPKNNRADSEA